jgi:hypothetical protein
MSARFREVRGHVRAPSRSLEALSRNIARLARLAFVVVLIGRVIYVVYTYEATRVASASTGSSNEFSWILQFLYRFKCLFWW